MVQSNPFRSCEPDQLWLCHDLLNYEHRCRQPIFNAVLYHDCIDDFRYGASVDSSLYHYRDPVALAAFAGAGIAGGDPMRTGFQALKLSLAGFIVPFLFVYNPAMLMIDTANVAVNAREFAFPAWTTIVSIVFTSVVGILALGAAVEGYFKVGLNWFWRIFLGAGALCMIIPETVTDIIGIVMVVIAISINIMQAKKQNQPYSLS